MNIGAGPGSVLAVVGENGAGKSTLMNILCGTEVPDSGSFHVDGAAVPPGNPLLSSLAGIGMVHQHPTGAPGLTVLENIILGYEPKRFFIFTDKNRAEKRIEELQAEYGLELDLKQPCSALNSAQIQRMELLHLLYKERKILIFDEPTASLSEPQTVSFFATVEKLKKKGMTIIFISHKLNEVFRIADSIAVLRKGAVVLQKDRSELSGPIVAEKMIGEKGEIDFPVRGRKNPEPGEVLYEMRELSYRRSGSRFVEKLNLSIGKGEILGITGIRENGLELLEDLISGMTHPRSGELYFKGKDVTSCDPSELRKLGISYVPANRLSRGVSADASIAENLILLNYKRMYPLGILPPSAVNRWAGELQKNYLIDGEPHQPVRHLSGGNIQKVILSRELLENPDLIIICEPSWGLDFKSRNRLHRELDSTAAGGAAVLLISSDIDEILALSDRIAVLYNGRITALKKSGELDRSAIGEYMLGIRSGN